MRNLVIVPGLLALAVVLLIMLGSMEFGACADMGLVPGDPRCS